MKIRKLLKNMDMSVHNEGDKDNENTDVKITIMMKTATDQSEE